MPCGLELLPLAAAVSPFVAVSMILRGDFTGGMKVLLFSPILVPVGILMTPSALLHYNRERKAELAGKQSRADYLAGQEKKQQELRNNAAMEFAKQTKIVEAQCRVPSSDVNGVD